MKTNKCENCKFWEYFDDADESESPYEDAGVGNCLKNPPVFIGIKLAARPHSPCNWEQPITTSHDRCGHWEKE